jgi:hypothetical protein
MIKYPDLTTSDHLIIGLLVLQQWASGIYWSGKEAYIAQTTNTFTGVATLTVTDSAGAKVTVSELINVTKY